MTFFTNPGGEGTDYVYTGTARSENDMWKQDDCVAGLTTHYETDPTLPVLWTNEWDQTNAPDEGKVVIPQGFILAYISRGNISATVSGGATTFTSIYDFPSYSDPMFAMNQNYCTIADSGGIHQGSPYSASSEIGSIGNPLGISFQHVYKHVIGRAKGDGPVPYRAGIIEVPYFSSDSLAAGVTKVVTLSPGTGNTYVLPGDFVRLGGNTLSGRFIRNRSGLYNSGSATESYQTIGQVVKLETYDTTYGGIMGWLEKAQFDPWYLLEPGTWYVSDELASAWPRGEYRGHRWPLYRDFRGIPYLTAGDSYAVTISEGFVPTSGAAQTYYLTSVYAWGPNVTASGPVDGGGTDLLTSLSLTKEMGGYYKLTYTCSGTTSATVSFTMTGHYPGLPIQLDRSGVVGLCHIRLMFD